MCFFKNDNSDELLDGIINQVKLVKGEKRINKLEFWLINKLEFWLEKMLLFRFLILILMFYVLSNCKLIIDFMRVYLV